MNINAMLVYAANLSDEAWISYAFSREPLSARINADERRRLFEKAYQCGRITARTMADQYHSCNPRTMAQAMNLQIIRSGEETGGPVPVFAQFIPPDRITLFTRHTQKAISLLDDTNRCFLNRILMEDMILAHEIFHWVEEQEKDTILTHKETILIGKKPFSRKAGIRCLSEIAGMAFAQELLAFPFCPFWLDLLLAYTVDKAMAEQIFCYLKTVHDKTNHKEKKRYANSYCF